jgi:hypothetical protein
MMSDVLEPHSHSFPDFADFLGRRSAVPGLRTTNALAAVESLIDSETVVLDALQASVSRATAQVTELQKTVAQLTNALTSRIVIEQAKGVLAERFELPLEDAFAVLRYSARTNRMSLHLLAARVLEKLDETPEIVTRALARPERWRPGATKRDHRQDRMRHMTARAAEPPYPAN